MTDQKHVLILGGGTGGTITANRLRRMLPYSVDITVVDGNDDHVYQPGLLFVPFGLTDAGDLVRPRGRQLHHGIDYLQATVERVDTVDNRVSLVGGRTLLYDVLVVATGAILMPEETEGLAGPGWGEKVFTFYSLDGARALEPALANFTAGRIVVNVVDMPIKCPVAPLEFCFLADWFFREKGIRDQVELTYVTPLDGAFTKPVASRRLGEMLADKGIEVITEFNTGTLDATEGKLVSYDGREVPFDLGVVVPLHGGADFIGRSPGLGDELNFIPTDPHTLQSEAAPNVFAIGDAAGLTASKAGSVTHFEGEVLTENIRRFLEGESLDASYDGHVNCFIETGFGKAVLIDFNYDTEPLPGHFPTRVGLPLLKESHLNHLGKLMFQWFYWHALLPGHSIPGIASDMPTAGKHQVPAGRTEGKHMTVATVEFAAVARNDEGFFLDPSQWSEAMVPALAAQEGITELTDRHWLVIRFMRSEYLEKGTGPTVRVLGKASGVSIKELYELFPRGPAKVAARIAGIPKPRGCI